MTKKRSLVLALALVTACLITGTLQAAPPGEKEDLIIYAYDSFVAEWGPAPVVIPKFEKKYDVTVKVVSVGDAGQVLNRVILEKEKPRADIILGIDNNMLSRALEEEVLRPYTSPYLTDIPEKLLFDDTLAVTPFDYGYFAFVYDSAIIKDPPESLEDLTDPRFKKKIILQDPRTSSPGLGFLLWTIAVYGDTFTEYWKRLMPNLLTITDGWDTAYGMFTAGEAPMVLSYTTSPPYHLEYEGTERYLALVFHEGNYIQIEGMGIVKGAPHEDMARKFIDFILTEDFQKEIALTNWMYPVNPRVSLPASFRLAPEPEIFLQIPAEEIQDNLDTWIEAWVRVVSR
ncbi:MAG: thiamine ABC transporter substrate-binding protein [Spirochaetales bacterium]|nr:thiamine ABC transporter substrate-binding protein [Spirochaetales bacterium]